jgi:hypothetical protein
VFILERLISRSSRSLAVMTGFARSAKGGGRESLRGSPDAAVKRFVCRRPPQHLNKSPLDRPKEPLWNAAHL